MQQSIQLPRTNPRRSSHKSPIVQYELIYQLRDALMRRGRQRGIWRKLLRWMWGSYRLSAWCTAGFVVAYPALQVILGYSGALNSTWDGENRVMLTVWAIGIVPMVILAPFVLLSHFGLLFRTMARAANSISREKESGTWELLLLSGLPARRIIGGKWWATLRGLAPQYARHILMRTALVIWLVLDATRVLSDLTHYTYSTHYLRIPAYPEGLNLGAFVVPLLLIAPLTLLTMSFAAACGVLASTLTKRPTMSIGLAVFFRTAILVGVWLGIGFIYLNFLRPLLFYSDTYNAYRVSGAYYYPGVPLFVESTMAFAGISAIDNGTFMSGMMLSYIIMDFTGEFDFRVFYLTVIFFAHLLLAAIGLLLIWLVLSAACWAARRQGALPRALPKAQPKQRT